MTKPKPITTTATAAAATSTHPVVQHLIKVLADTYVLGVKTHGAHWNVKGPGFFRLQPL